MKHPCHLQCHFEVGGILFVDYCLESQLSYETRQIVYYGFSGRIGTTI